MRVWLLGLVGLCLCACNRPSAAVELSPVASATPAFTATAVIPEPTLPPSATSTIAPTQAPISNRQSPTATPTLTPTPTATPSNTPNPFADLTIEALAGRVYGGGELQIEDKLLEGETFARYLISYPSDGLTVYGFMNVPHDGWHFPVALVLHGYINPAVYETETYTTRYADALAEAGYFVIHPNYRSHPPSNDGPNPFRIGYAIDILNLIAIIQEHGGAAGMPDGPLRRADPSAIHLLGHSMGGGVALRVITARPEVARAAVLYGSMSGDELKNYQQIQEWTGQAGLPELELSNDMLAQISPIYALGRIEAAVAIHHGEADDHVPPEWSADLCARLQATHKVVECYTYPGQPHTFRGAGDQLFIERVIAFFGRY